MPPMVRVSVLADAPKSSNNAERGEGWVSIGSPVIVQFLSVMRKHSYPGEFEITDDYRAGKVVLNLTGSEWSQAWISQPQSAPRP